MCATLRVCVCMRVCMNACVCLRVSACVCVCVLYLGAAIMDRTHFCCGPTLVQFLASVTMALASSRP